MRAAMNNAAQNLPTHEEFLQKYGAAI